MKFFPIITLSLFLVTQATSVGQSGKSITCSVDPIKIASALAGNKGACIEILNCCEAGFDPLPSGCTKDLIDAVHKILGTKSDPPQAVCPPGFSAGRSSSFKGQCCTGTIESAQACCPAPRANLMGFCCPTDKVAKGVSCVDPGAQSVDGTDGTTPADAGTPDAGTPPVDAGTPPADAGTPPVDAGTPPADAGTPPVDAGTPPVDAGTPPADAGTTPADQPSFASLKMKIYGHHQVKHQKNQQRGMLVP